jgi:hypothetical protein
MSFCSSELAAGVQQLWSSELLQQQQQLALLLQGSFAAAGAHQITLEVCGQNSLYSLEYQPHQNICGDHLLLLLPHETPMDSRLQAALKSPRSSFAAKLNVLSRAPFFLFLRLENRCP